MMRPYAKIVVPLAGTPVRVTSVESDPNARRAIHGVLVQALPDNAGRVYVGNVSMNRVARTNLFGILAVPTTNSLPTFSAALTLSPNAIHLNDIYIDVDQNGDGCIISILET